MSSMITKSVCNHVEGNLSEILESLDFLEVPPTSQYPAGAQAPDQGVKIASQVGSYALEWGQKRFLKAQASSKSSHCFLRNLVC